MTWILGGALVYYVCVHVNVIVFYSCMVDGVFYYYHVVLIVLLTFGSKKKKRKLVKRSLSNKLICIFKQQEKILI